MSGRPTADIVADLREQLDAYSETLSPGDPLRAIALEAACRLLELEDVSVTGWGVATKLADELRAIRRGREL